MVGASGFEPPASCSRSRRASQAALRPDNQHGKAQRLAAGIFRLAYPHVAANNAECKRRVLLGGLPDSRAIAKKEKPPESLHSPAAAKIVIDQKVKRNMNSITRGRVSVFEYLPKLHA